MNYYYYPKRTDGVRAVTFNDEQSVQRIREHLGKPDISIVYLPDTPKVMHVMGHAVPQGHVVVMTLKGRHIIEVLDPWEFLNLYSEDGR